MRSVKLSRQFINDVTGRRRKTDPRAWRTLSNELNAIVELLERRIVLPPQCNNHRIKGTSLWYCYIDDDFVMLYDLPDDDNVELRRFGLYSEVFPSP